MTQQDVPTARRGVVTTEPDGRRRLVFRRSWPDPVEDVWAALTEPERMARWIGRYDGERGPGATGTFTMTHEQEPGSQAVHILECDPPRRLVLEWSLGEDPWRVELDLSTDGTTTTLVFTQAFRAGFPRRGRRRRLALVPRQAGRRGHRRGGARRMGALLGPGGAALRRRSLGRLTRPSPRGSLQGGASTRDVRPTG